MHLLQVNFFVDLLEKWVEDGGDTEGLFIFIVKYKGLSCVNEVLSEVGVAAFAGLVRETEHVVAGVVEALVLHQLFGERSSIVVGRVLNEC